jgi:glycosyltransferase involved in cell wall biosynthesis
MWFTSVPLPAVCQELGLATDYGGWWVYSLLLALAGDPDVEVSVAWASRGCSERRCFSVDNVRYYVIPDPGRFVRGGGIWRGIDNQLSLLFGLDRDRNAVAETAAAIEDYQPDIVHVFGSENPHGLAATSVRQPVMVWIQGILDVYRHHFFGSMTCRERLLQPRLLWDYHRMAVNAAREREIFRRCRHFIGRTSWDAAHQARLQPEGRYYHVQDCLRPEFHGAAAWCAEQSERYTIYTTTSGSLLKGTDVLIQAVALLRATYPTIGLRIGGLLDAGNPVAQRLFALVERHGLRDCVEFLGMVEAGRIVDELRRARVFALPSFIENNPNSLIEAQLVGTPTVAALVGGVQDTVAHGETGLLYQAGDSAMLAHQIGLIVADDGLAFRLARRARQIALARHAPEAIATSMRNAYEAVLSANVRQPV